MVSAYGWCKCSKLSWSSSDDVLSTAMSGSFVVSKHIQCSPFGNFTRSLEETQPPIVDDLSFSAVVSFPVPSKAFTKISPTSSLCGESPNGIWCTWYNDDTCHQKTILPTLPRTFATNVKLRLATAFGARLGESYTHRRPMWKSNRDGLFFLG